MPIQDTNPERRNLLITSLCFIAYYYAGGTINGETLKLPFVDLAFSKPYALGVIAWLVFFWFFYKYWVTHKNQASSGIQKELQRYLSDPLVNKYFRRKTGFSLAVYPDESGYYLLGFDFNSFPPTVSYDMAGMIQWSAKNNMATTQSAPNSEIRVLDFRDFIGGCVLFGVLLKCCFQQSTFSSYVAPYVLFLVAIVGPFIPN